MSPIDHGRRRKPPPSPHDPRVIIADFAGETAKFVMISILKSMGINEVIGANNILAMAEKITAYLIDPKIMGRPSALIVDPPKLRFALEKDHNAFWLRVILRRGEGERLIIDEADLKNRVPTLEWEVVDDQTTRFKLT